MPTSIFFIRVAIIAIFLAVLGVVVYGNSTRETAAIPGEDPGEVMEDWREARTL